MRCLVWLGLGWLGLGCGVAFADQFHYNNILVGDRAIGLGGAYAGVADDASGVYYNPAGIGFALNNNVSGSANAIFTKSVRYKKAVGNQDFVERSQGSLPSFFGGMQKLDQWVPGLVFAFATFTTDGEQKDQNDVFEKVAYGPTTLRGCEIWEQEVGTGRYGPDRPGALIERFHRTANHRAATFNVAAALGWRVLDNIAVGIGLSFVGVDELSQEYQDVQILTNTCVRKDALGKADPTMRRTTQNVRQRLAAKALMPVMGVQGTFFEKLSVGASLRFGRYLSQSLELDSERHNLSLPEAMDTLLEKNASQGMGTVLSPPAEGFVLEQAYKLTKPLGQPGVHARLGLAYYFTPSLLAAADVTHHSAVVDVQRLGGQALYSRLSVVNYAVGAEYYLTPSLPVRVGLFTNKDARGKVVRTASNQRDHVDYQGADLFLSWVQPNSQMGAGVVRQTGKGQGQKAEDRQIQDINASAFTFAFSATHSF